MSTSDAGAAAALYAQKYHAARAEVDSLRAVVASLRAALSDTAEALNATRLIMRDKEARDHAGALVDVARRIVRATS